MCRKIVIFVLGFSIMLTVNCVFADTTEEVELRILYDEIEHYELMESTYRDIINNYPNANQALDSLLQTAIEAEKQTEYERAKNAYQQIIQQYSNAPLVKRVQLDIERMNILSLLKSGDNASAGAAVNKLLTDFSGNEHLAEAIHHTAYRHRVLGKYDKANELDRYVMKNWPTSDYALWAQMDMAETNINLDNEAAAQADIDKLLADFAGHSRIAEAVHHVAVHYRQLKKYDKAQQIDEYVIAHWPTSDFALWAQMDIAEFNIERGDDAAVDSAISKLLTGFSSHRRIAEAVHHTAYYCRQLRKYDKANQLDGYVMDHWPKTNYAMWAQMDMARTHIELGEQAAAEAAIDKLMTDFTGHPGLLGVLSGPIAEGLYEKAFKMDPNSEGQRHAYLQKAVGIWEMVTKQSPSLTSTADGFSWAGHCYRELGQYEKAIDCYQKVVDSFPKHRLASNDLFLIGQCVQGLKESGKLSEAEAKLRIKGVNQRLVEKYPGSPAVKIAQQWLSKNTN
jgi:TolA-binding protein